MRTISAVLLAAAMAGCFAKSATVQPAAPASPAPAAGLGPSGLTAWRTPQGIYLSWSTTPEGAFEIWRGTFSGGLSLVATLPPGTQGFVDIAAHRTQGYWYALGAGKKPGAALEVPGAPAAAHVLAGLVTTCSGLMPNSLFPANTQNYFFKGRSTHVQYFGYFLLKPYDPSPRDVRLVWKDPHGAVFAEISKSVNPKKLDMPEGPVGQVLLSTPVGLQAVVAQNGQKSVPDEPGTYTVEAFIDDVPVALTVFYLKEEASQAKPAAQ